MDSSVGAVAHSRESSQVDSDSIATTGSQTAEAVQGSTSAKSMKQQRIQDRLALVRKVIDSGIFEFGDVGIWGSRHGEMCE